MGPLEWKIDVSKKARKVKFIATMSTTRTIDEIELIVSASAWATAVRNDRNDNLWADLGKECGLSNPELSLLKTKRFPRAEQGQTLIISLMKPQRFAVGARNTGVLLALIFFALILSFLSVVILYVHMLLLL